jgi:hypothetical protein
MHMPTALIPTYRFPLDLVNPGTKRKKPGFRILKARLARSHSSSLKSL